jgi:hypothetical protein
MSSGTAEEVIGTFRAGNFYREQAINVQSPVLLPETGSIFTFSGGIL